MNLERCPAWDEKAWKRGHVNATVICDSTVLDVGQGRIQKGTIERFEMVFEGIKDKVETGFVEGLAFIEAVETVFPKAALIHDRFHLPQ